MITSLEIENFKGFGSKSQRIELAPITLLFGGNSAGKSSFFQALFYLREILETSLATPGEMSFFAPKIDLGGFTNVVHAHDAMKKIRFHLTICTVEHDEEADYSFGNDPIGIEVVIANADGYRAFVEKFRLDWGGRKIVEFTAKWNSNHKWMDIDISFDFENISQTHIDIPTNTSGKWTTIYRFAGAAPIERDPILSMCFRRDGTSISDEERTFFEEIDQLLIESIKLARDNLDDMLFIGPLRAIPPSDYSAQPKPAISRWAEGIAAWDLLHFASFDDIDTVNTLLDNLDLGVWIEKQLLVPISTIFTSASKHEETPRIRLIPLTKSRNTLVAPRLRVQDVGFGVSQIIPVVVAIELAKQRYVLVEQPEIHLHPRLQTRLGDVLIGGCLSQDAKKFAIMETHSEHLLLRILKRIRQTTDDDLPEDLPRVHSSDVAVNHFQTGEKGTIVSRLRINESGEFIDSWPQGFFDERIEELY